MQQQSFGLAVAILNNHVLNATTKDKPVKIIGIALNNRFPNPFGPILILPLTF